jgi:hypothetical protein
VSNFDGQRDKTLAPADEVYLQRQRIAANIAKLPDLSRR